MSELRFPLKIRLTATLQPCGHQLTLGATEDGGPARIWWEPGTVLGCNQCAMRVCGIDIRLAQAD